MVAIAGAAVVASAVIAGVVVRRVEVHGRSMLPHLQPGDRLVVIPLRRAHPGQIVAVRHPRDSGQVLVKRVWAVGPAGVDVRGDHAAQSTDSRSFGPVAPASIVGRAVYRYFPPLRAGRLDG